MMLRRLGWDCYCMIAVWVWVCGWCNLHVQTDLLAGVLGGRAGILCCTPQTHLGRSQTRMFAACAAAAVGGALCAACSEEALYSALAAVVPNIVDMRVIKDKFTGAPRCVWGGGVQAH